MEAVSQLGISTKIQLVLFQVEKTDPWVVNTREMVVEVSFHHTVAWKQSEE